MSRGRRLGPRAQSGFILVAVLVLLVIISLLAGAVAVVSDRAIADAQADTEAFETELATIGTRDTLLFLLSSQRQTYAGLTLDERVSYVAGHATAVRAPAGMDDGLPPRLPVGNEIRLDGTVYEGLAGVRFALQDDGGLFSPNWTFDFFRPGFYSALGIPATSWAGLEAKRLDYQDPDDLYRLDGGEIGHYRSANLPPPRNSTLLTPLELRNVLGWRTALEKLDDTALARTFTVTRTVSINVNTAPPATLQAIPGVDRATAERIAALRETTPYMLQWQLIADFRLPVDELAPLGLLPVGAGTLFLWHNARGPVRAVHWTLTPTDQGGRPWRIDYEITLPRDPALASRLARKADTTLLAEPAADRR